MMIKTIKQIVTGTVETVYEGRNDLLDTLDWRSLQKSYIVFINLYRLLWCGENFK